MNKETQMVWERIKDYTPKQQFNTVEELQKYVDTLEPHVFGVNEKGQWSWRLAREQKELVDWDHLVKLIQSDTQLSLF